MKHIITYNHMILLLALVAMLFLAVPVGIDSAKATTNISTKASAISDTGGQSGQDGKDGRDGAPGEDGEPGEDGQSVNLSQPGNSSANAQVRTVIDGDEVVDIQTNEEGGASASATIESTVEREDEEVVTSTNTTAAAAAAEKTTNASQLGAALASLQSLLRHYVSLLF